MTLDGLTGSFRVFVAIVAAGAAAWACELEGDPPTQVPIAQADSILEEAYCERMFDCPCEQGRRFDTLEGCSANVREDIDALEARIEATGLTYDPTCLGAWVDALEDLGCSAVGSDDAGDECVPPCAILHGDVPIGGACRDFNGDSDCAQGLQCNVETCDGGDSCSGTCIAPCDGPCPGGCADDERCDQETLVCEPLPQLGESCVESGCAPGLGCLYEDDGSSAQCVKLPGLGGSCVELLICKDELRCDLDPQTMTAVCVGPSAIDEPCAGHSECDSGYCPAGFCAALPGKGDSCAGTSACAEGLDCDPETQVCVTGDAIVCDLSLEID